MPQVLSIELYQLLEEKLGKEEAKKVASAIEIGIDVIEKKADAVALQKKLELKDELTKELANKTDIVRLEGKIETDIVRLEGKIETDIARLEGKIEKEILRLDRKFTIMFIILFFTIIFLNQNALEFFIRVLGVIK
ncbi:MAG: hypothetical protein HY761_08620 [Candidatus Omnitrophica bacterium]|nr:hypothetical protein [Candidatus Omnitrophota bacterium]